MSDKSLLLEHLENTITLAQNNLETLKTAFDFNSFANAIPGLNLQDAALPLSLNAFSTTTQLELALILKSILINNSAWESLHLLKLALITINQSLTYYDSFQNDLNIFIQKHPKLAPFLAEIENDITLFVDTYASKKDFIDILDLTGSDFFDFNNYYETASKIKKDETIEKCFIFLLLLTKIFEFSTDCYAIDLGDLNEKDVKQLKLKMEQTQLKASAILNAFKNQN